MRIKGTYTALVTPFKEDESIDFDKLKNLFDFQLKNQVDGLVILGTTGETPSLLEDEQKLLIDFAVKHLKGKTKIIIGTGTYSTLKTIKLTKQAEEAGADMVLIVTPYYNKPTQEGIFRHFQAVAASSSMPIIVYNIQGRTGRNIETDTLRRLADLPTVKGVKEASGNVEQMMEVIDLIAHNRDDFSVLSGDDALTLPLMALGGDGVISVVSNLIPGLIKEMVDTALSGDFVRAKKMHYNLLPLFRSAFIETNPTPIKEALNMAGFAVGNVRLPLCELKQENRAHLKATLEKMKLL